jgi:hypothetical protein
MFVPKKKVCMRSNDFLSQAILRQKLCERKCLSVEIGETQTLKFCSTFAGGRRCVTCVLKPPSKAALAAREKKAMLHSKDYLRLAISCCLTADMGSIQ